MSEILTVRELTEALRRRVESAFPFVWVKGEVSNMSRPSSGHIYFSLKDADALLNCVWFRNRQGGDERFDPLTGEVFDSPRPSLARALANGQTVLCAGQISVYAPRGSYQLVVELAQEAGLGELHRAFELLKARLAGLGYFSQGRKRPLPPNPGRVAVITAPSGAAIRDFLRLAAERGSGAEIRVYPALMQGAGAAAGIAAGIAAVNAENWAQVLVLIRGGGSLEDLWAFNEEIVAGAVFNSNLPVVAGIGHEVDITMADMTADVRAATPSHAAQLIWPARAELAQLLDDAEAGMRRAAMRRLEDLSARLLRLESALRWLSPVQSLRRRALELAALEQRMRGVFASWFSRKREAGIMLGSLDPALAKYIERRKLALENLGIRLEALNPAAPLERGFALAADASGRVLRGVGELRPGDVFGLEMADGKLKGRVLEVEPLKKI